MQRTVFDREYTPAAAKKIGPGLAKLYPPREFDHIWVKTRVGNVRRERIVIQHKKKKRR